MKYAAGPCRALLWNAPNRVFLFVPEELTKDAFARLPADSSYLLGESGGKYLLVNQSVRPDLPTLASLLKRLGDSSSHP